MQINNQSRDVFYVSDGTAITCETLGHVVLGQFPFIPNEKTFPFVESQDKVADVVKEIETSYQRNGVKPLVFFSIVVPGVREMLLEAPAYSYDVLESIVQKVQDDIQMAPAPKLQRSRSVGKDSDTYFDRIAAIEYTLAHDDGITLKGLEQADIILAWCIAQRQNTNQFVHGDAVWLARGELPVYCRRRQDDAFVARVRGTSPQTVWLNHHT